MIPALPVFQIPVPALLKFVREPDHGTCVCPHKLQFSRDGFDIWVVSLFTVVLVVVLDGNYSMKYIYTS